MCLAAFIEMCQFLFIHTVSIRPVHLFRLFYPHYPHFKPSVRLFHLCLILAARIYMMTNRFQHAAADTSGFI